MKKISLTLLLCIILFSGCTQKNHTESAVYPSDNLIPDKSAGENEQVSNMNTYEFETQELFAKRDDNQIYGVIYILALLFIYFFTSISMIGFIIMAMVMAIFPGIATWLPNKLLG